MGGLSEGEAPHRLLDGRVRLRQPAAGLRAGMDAVMLAAACPIRVGESVLDLGCGPGGVMLCILARVAGTTACGVEREPVLAELARGNIALNGWEARGRVITGEADGALGGRFHHAVCNPPWWPGGTAPPGPLRRGATHADGTPLATWAHAMARALRPRGSASLVLPAALFDRGVEALREGGFGALEIWPLWPRAGVAARRVLLRGRLGARGGGAVRPGLVLHGPGGWTATAQAILRDAASLEDATGVQFPASG